MFGFLLFGRYALLLTFLLSATAPRGFSAFVTSSFHSTRKLRRPSAVQNNGKDSGDDNEQASTDILPLLNLASAHFASQALYTALQLNIPDILGTNACSLKEICNAIGPTTNADALLRTMRLLTTVGILHEEQENNNGSILFSLTNTGLLLQRKNNQQGQPNMASCIHHWMERPLWNAWLELPQYIRQDSGTSLPFDRANDGISSDFFYNAQDHPESLKHANAFVRLIHDNEVKAVVEGYDWKTLNHKRLLDIGGHHGKVLGAIVEKYPLIDCICLDLPQVISSAPAKSPFGVKLVGGNVFEPSTMPECDTILLKHFLDRCMWTEEESIKVLLSCRSVLRQGGKIIIAEAVLPDIGQANEVNQVQLYMDALYMLVGREGQRTKAEWECLAAKAGLEIEQIAPTNVPSCYIIVLQPRLEAFK